MKASEITKNLPLTEEVRQKIQAHLKTLEVQRIIQSFDNCGICAAPIEFSYQTDRLRFKVLEQGHCSHCQRKIAARNYSLS